MAYLMSLDIGTSSLKTMIIDEEGLVKSICAEEYTIEIPHEGFAEQNPEVWWSAAITTIRKSLNITNITPSEIKCIGISGQMHGMVLVDKKQNVIRDAIIHSDQRSRLQVERINNLIGKEEIGSKTLNSVFPGFQLASLLWVKENEPENYNRTFKVILPKDYIRMKLTGNTASDYTDASSTLAFNPIDRKWEEDIITRLNIDIEMYPSLGESYEIAGYVTKSVSDETGLKRGTPVVYGASDQPMQALGNGVIKPGTGTSTIGTGGQIYTPVDKPILNRLLNTHTFCNITPDTWYMMGAMMSAGLSLKWFRDNIINNLSYKQMDEKANEISPGSEGLIFLPYLAGERTPHLNPNLKGMFFGLTLKHNSANMARSIMEGVTYGLKDSLEILKTLGADINQIIASGGGAQSKLWLQIQADIFGTEIYTTNTIEQACTGAAILAGVGIGIYSDFEEACKVVVKRNPNPIEPIFENVKKYEYFYEKYKNLYKSNSNIF
ncbi:xylulokinase [Bacillus sp. Marseille-P3661]|uniref:xylulokinase n=1 Tax=Bacillus sp. Marseille-P3661 TaxID=1936234 RepID=UPI000C8268DB|nr:xylulokinase [Bacillus sp. Marseille-P3661]